MRRVGSSREVVVAVVVEARENARFAAARNSAMLVAVCKVRRSGVYVAVKSHLDH